MAKELAVNLLRYTKPQIWNRKFELYFANPFPRILTRWSPQLFAKQSKTSEATSADRKQPRHKFSPLLIGKFRDLQFSTSTTLPSAVDKMVSASKAAREAKRAAEGKAPKKTVASRSKAGSKNASGASSIAGDETPPLLDGDGNPVPEDDQPATSGKKLDEVKRLADQMDKHGLSDRVTTGVLSSLKQSRDVKITSVSLVFHGRVLISDTTMELTYGRRYGLLGENGMYP